MSSHTVTSPSPLRPSESGGSGTRQAAFLRPLPGERREGQDSASRTVGGDGRAAELFERLFPRNDAPDASDATLSSAAGVRLGHFVIEERIGRGGMGGVFRAVDERLNRVVALKVLAPAYARDAAAAERFRNEAQAAARLDHENIARVYFIGEDQGAPFIAFEFVRGTNVRDFILQKGMLSPAEGVNYTLQIAQALRHTQAARVVHRDIKPSNIIITPAGHAKLVDLGLARQEQIEPARELTVPGTTLGTFDYIAPEQARDPRDVDVRTDIYSLGCTLYHMLTGEPPFPQGTIIQKVVDHHRDAPPDPADRNPLVPPQLSQIVRKMMASNPDERYAGPDPLIHDLVQVATALGLQPTYGDNLIWVRPLYEQQPGFFDQNKGWLLTLAALVLIAAVVQNLDQYRQTPDNTPAGDSPAVADVAPEAPPGQIDQLARSLADGASGMSAGAAERTLPLPTARLSAGAPATAGGSLGGASSHPDAAAIDDASPPTVGAAPLDSTDAAELAVNAVDRRVNDLTTPVPNALRPPAGDASAQDIPAGSPFVVIDPAGGTERGFATLEAACQSAQEDALIEVRFNGRLAGLQPPVRIQNKRLTIRAQSGLRPAIEFQSAAEGGSGRAAPMIQINEGGLVLQDVDIAMTASAERSALFSLSQADELQLQGVSIVIANPQRQPAAVVEFAAQPGHDQPALMPESMHREEVLLDWRDCLIRAECDLFAFATLSPADIRCENVAAAIRGTLALCRGSTAPAGRVNQDRQVALRLRHVTALLYDGLLRVDTGSDYDREFLPFDVECDESALLVRPGQPLVAMVGHQELTTLRRRLTLQSSRSVFDVSGPAGELTQTTPALGRQRMLLGFGDLNIDPLRSVETDLSELPFRWDDGRYATVDTGVFRLRRPSSAVHRDAVIGARFDGRMPTAAVKPSDDPAVQVEPRS